MLPGVEDRAPENSGPRLEQIGHQGRGANRRAFGGGSSQSLQSLVMAWGLLSVFVFCVGCGLSGSLLEGGLVTVGLICFDVPQTFW